MAGGDTRIHVQRSGGLAGLVVRRTVDSKQLSAEDAMELQRLVQAADWDAPAVQPPGADRFQYDVDLESGSERRHLVAHEGTMPAGTKALFDWVLEHGSSSD